MFVFVVLLLVPAFLLISFLLAQGGWSRLAERYRARTGVEGPTWRFQYGTVGLARYGYTLTFTVTDAGLGVRVFPLYRFMHPPLLIPWRDLAVRREKVFWVWRVELTAREVPGVVVVVGQGLALALARAAGPLWPDREMLAEPAAANARTVD